MDNTPNTETSAVAPGGDRHPDEKDAQSVEETAHKVGLGRSIIYRALNPDPSKRDGLPFLPSLKAGKRRLIRAEARRAWLRQLEELESASAKSAA
jgi:predicted DNA-binding transcriptional regulator AlpA